MVTGGPHSAVSFIIKKDMSTAFVFMYKCIYFICLHVKCFLIKTAQPKRVGTIKERSQGLISRLYNCMAIDRSRYANYLQSARREYARHVEHSLTDCFSFAGVR